MHIQERTHPCVHLHQPQSTPLRSSHSHFLLPRRRHAERGPSRRGRSAAAGACSLSMQYRFRQRDGSPIGRGPTGDAFDHARLSPGSRRKCPYRHCRRAPPRAAHQREKYYTTRLHTGSLHYRHQVASAAYTGRSLPTHSTSVPRYTTRGGDYPLTPLPEEPPYLPTFNLDAFVWYTSSCNRTLSFSFFCSFFDSKLKSQVSSP